MKDLTFSGGDLEKSVTFRVDLLNNNSDNTTLLETYNLNDRQSDKENVQTEIGRRLINFLKVEYNIRDFILFAVENNLSLTIGNVAGNESEVLVDEGEEIGAVKVEDASIRDREPTNGSDKGGYIVNINFDREIKYIDALDVYLSREGRKLVKNSLNRNYEGLDLEKDSTTCPFNFGSLGLDEWAWNRGAYPIKGNEVTEDDKPDEVIIVVQSKDQATSFVLSVESDNGGDDEEEDE